MPDLWGEWIGTGHAPELQGASPRAQTFWVPANRPPSEWAVGQVSSGPHPTCLTLPCTPPSCPPDLSSALFGPPSPLTPPTTLPPGGLAGSVLRRAGIPAQQLECAGRLSSLRVNHRHRGVLGLGWWSQDLGGPPGPEALAHPTAPAVRAPPCLGKSLRSKWTTGSCPSHPLRTLLAWPGTGLWALLLGQEPGVSECVCVGGCVSVLEDQG